MRCCSATSSRARDAFSGVISILAACMVLALPAVASDRGGEVAAAIAVGVVCAMSVWVWRATGEKRGYPRTLLRAYATTIAIGVVFLEYFAGVFSA